LAAGNASIWKPSPTTPLCSIAVTSIIADVLERNEIPGAVACLLVGGQEVGAAIVESHEVDLGKWDSRHNNILIMHYISIIYRERKGWS
jgi:aldehyde dehydrogenase family 7 protein A1